MRHSWSVNKSIQSKSMSKSDIESHLQAGKKDGAATSRLDGLCGERKALLGIAPMCLKQRNS